jgi:hypothetical protein
LKRDGTRTRLEFDRAGAAKPRGCRLRSLASRAWLAGAGLTALLSASGHAQVLQTWTHKSAFSDASGAIAMGDTLMFVNNNEDEILGLYSRRPVASCPTAVYSFNARPFLGATGSDLSADLESAVKLVDSSGTRIYWLGSLSNSKSGALRPNRSRIFVTLVKGDGSSAAACSLTYVGRYDRLRDDILAWDQNNLHGLGANYFGLVASAASGVIPQGIDGFNAEGIALAPDGTTAYIGFRAPLVNNLGPTTAVSPRTHALIIPLLNMPALVADNPTPGPGAAQFGAASTATTPASISSRLAPTMPSAIHPSRPRTSVCSPGRDAPSPRCSKAPRRSQRRTAPRPAFCRTSASPPRLSSRSSTTTAARVAGGA